MRLPIPSPWKYMTLRWRLALVLFSLLALLLAIMSTMIVYTAERILLTSQAQVLQNQFLPLAQDDLIKMGTISSSNSTDTPQEATNSQTNTADYLVTFANNTVKQFSNPNLRATILAPSGRIIAALTSLDNDANNVKLDAYPGQVQISSAQIQDSIHRWSDNGNEDFSLAYDHRGERQLVLLLPLLGSKTSREIVAVLQLNTPTASLDGAINTIRLLLLGGILTSLLIAALCTIPLINVALRPLVAMEQTSKRIAGGELSLRLMVPPVHDEIGRLARTFNYMVDRLETTLTRQKRFVADVSHELRTPLTALGGSMEMLMLGADQGDPKALRRLIRGMYTEVQRLQRLVSDLLTLAKLDEGRTPFRREPVDLTDVIERVFQQMQQLAQGQRLYLELGEKIPWVVGDADRLQQVLLNIGDNALKFTSPTANIRLSAEAGGERVIITMQDEGCGIPASDLPQIFDRFYRVDLARSRAPHERGGNGLGLAIAQEIVKGHGGCIEIESEERQGTTVRVMLPL